MTTVGAAIALAAAAVDDIAAAVVLRLTVDMQAEEWQLAAAAVLLMPVQRVAAPSIVQRREAAVQPTLQRHMLAVDRVAVQLAEVVAGLMVVVDMAAAGRMVAVVDTTKLCC